jgi:hypothetical protein
MRGKKMRGGQITVENLPKNANEKLTKEYIKIYLMFKINEFKKLIVLENDITLLKQAIFLLDEYIPKIDDGIEKQIKNIAHLSRERLTCLDFAIGVLLS